MYINFIDSVMLGWQVGLEDTYLGFKVVTVGYLLSWNVQTNTLNL